MRPLSTKTAKLRIAIKAIIDKRMLTLTALAAELHTRKDTVGRILERMAMDGIAVYRRTTPGGWATPRLYAELYPTEAKFRKIAASTPSANVPLRPAPMVMPEPHVTYSKGVKFTRQAAPKGRYEVTLPPGGGVISYDNKRLAAALLV